MTMIVAGMWLPNVVSAYFLCGGLLVRYRTGKEEYFNPGEIPERLRVTTR